MQYDVVIDGKGYFFGKRLKKIGGVSYEIPDNEYPIEFIVENSDMMIMLEKHCDIPLIQRKTNPKTGEHIAKISVDFHGGWSEQVRRLCDQKNTRTIIFIAESPETPEPDQPEIPFSDIENYRVWRYDEEYQALCFRNNAEIARLMSTYKFQQDSDGEAYAIEDVPYSRTCYVSDRLNEFAPLKSDVSEQEHYETLRKTNPPKTSTPKMEKASEPSLKNFAKSLEV